MSANDASWPTLVLEGRPTSKKNKLRIVTPGGRKGGRPFLVHEKAYQVWEKAAALRLMAQWRPRPTITGCVGMQLTVVMAPVQRLDLGNVVTAVCDALQAGRVLEDDKQIVELTYCTLAIGRDPYLEIRLWPRPEIRQVRRRGATPGLGL